MAQIEIWRKSEKVITEWIRKGKKALLVYGVRQAGKTFAIRKCLERQKCDYVEFNLIETPEIATLIRDAKNTNDLILKLSLFTEKKIVPKKTIIFFDEIQQCKEIVTRIKFLVEDRRFRYVMSGSLLGVEITNLKSAPVGYLQTHKMFPLDFEEFASLFNVPDGIIGQLKTCFKKRLAVDEIVHAKMLELFNLYLIVGGMPAAAAAYAETQNIDDVISEHNSIAELYKLDFTKYETENRRLVISKLYEMIPAELNENNKRFMIADLNKNLRVERVQESFVWLEKAGVALPVYNVVEPKIPLMLNQKSTLFKLFLSDTGMLTTFYGKSAKLKIVSGERDINKGAIFENAVAQELATRSCNLYYYNSKKFGELDFVMERDGEPLPIEVKSGKAYERHSALDNVLNSADFNVGEAIVFSSGNVKTEGQILYLPIYMVMFLGKE